MGQNRLLCENHQLFLENLVFLGSQSSMDTLAEASPDAAATKLRKERLSATWGELKQGCATRKHGEERNKPWDFNGILMDLNGF
jgi:hypothetical protein